MVANGGGLTGLPLAPALPLRLLQARRGRRLQHLAGRCCCPVQQQLALLAHPDHRSVAQDLSAMAVWIVRVAGNRVLAGTAAEAIRRREREGGTDRPLIRTALSFGTLGSNILPVVFTATCGRHNTTPPNPPGKQAKMVGSGSSDKRCQCGCQTESQSRRCLQKGERERKNNNTTNQQRQQRRRRQQQHV